MKKIESCPHCGGVSKVRKEDNAYFVRCEDCGGRQADGYTGMAGVSPAQV